MKNVKKIITNIFWGSVILFTVLAILAIWDVLPKEIAGKSLSTLGVIFLASLVSIAIMNNLNQK